MEDMLLKLFLMFLMVIGAGGCATNRKSVKNLEAEIQELTAQVTELEAQVSAKDKMLGDMEDRLQDSTASASAKYDGSKTAVKHNIASGITPKKIQKALKGAGLYDGPIEGRIGKRTKKAIKEFQKANGLTDDGIVGKKTWLILSVYISE